MGNVLTVDHMKQKLKIIAPYVKTTFDKKKPYYIYSWKRLGWEEVYIWDTTALDCRIRMP
tara:strand:+ start:2602 stop:2781 length:180 start_codon:yes stop_codon:yes gene_type:complete